MKTDDTRLALADAEPGAGWLSDPPWLLFWRSEGGGGGGHHLIAGRADGTGEHPIGDDAITYAQVDPAGARVAALTRAGGLLIHTLADRSTDVIIPTLAAPPPDISVEIGPILQWSPDGDRILVEHHGGDTNGDGKITYFDTAHLTLVDVAERRHHKIGTWDTMAAFLWLSDGRAVLFDSIDDAGRGRLMRIPDGGVYSRPVVFDDQPERDDQLSTHALHVNLTPTTVVTSTALAQERRASTSPGQLEVGEDPAIEISGPGQKFLSPTLSTDGRLCGFYAEKSIYLLDTETRRLARVASGEPSPVIVHPGYRPHARRLDDPAYLFDLAYRSF